VAEHVGELGGGEPALALHYDAPGPRHDAVEADHADGNEAEEECRKRRRGWRIAHGGWILLPSECAKSCV
jgi:hypothetical protein